jgi:hypothetical protein
MHEILHGRDIVSQMGRIHRRGQMRVRGFSETTGMVELNTGMGAAGLDCRRKTLQTGDVVVTVNTQVVA